MARKFCPLSFFSFYVNKENSQAGGAHHCVEEACALWDESYEQCGLKSAVDSFGMLAEGGGIPVRQHQRREKLVGAVSGGMLSTFDKLRKKLPTAGPPPRKVESATPASVAASQGVTVAKKPALVGAAVGAVATTPVVEQKTTVPPTPPVKDVNKNSENNLTLPIVEKIGPIVNPAEVAPKEVKEAVTKPSVAAPPITTPKDFSDLLNPPSIPISELPIISKPLDKEMAEIVRPEPLVSNPMTRDWRSEPVIEVKPEPTPVIEVKPEPVIEVKPDDDPLAEILAASKLVPEMPGLHPSPPLPEIKEEMPGLHPTSRPHAGNDPEIPAAKPTWQLPDDIPIPEEFLQDPDSKEIS